jgi:hypothetical protein
MYLAWAYHFGACCFYLRASQKITIVFCEIAKSSVVSLRSLSERAARWTVSVGIN